jgi:phospholipid/cholesterol/gamma-HCH transport system ATP-binding protein
MTTHSDKTTHTPTPDSSPDVVISLRNVTKAFTSPAGNTVRVLDGVTFDILRGECLVIMGGSGCGKSTLLNCLIGELQPNAGQITYKTREAPEAVDITRLDEEAFASIRRKFGILFQSGALLNSLSVEQNVALPLREHTELEDAIIDIVCTLKLEQVRMLSHRDKMPAQLSGGQKKRAALARALALDPEILYYDEPSAGLDPVTSAEIDRLIVDLTRKVGVTSVVVTHEMDSAFTIADRMIMLDKGRVLRIGPRSDFDRIRSTPMDQLTSRDDRLINQFLNGLPAGPLTDTEGMSEFEQIIVTGQDKI